ncbi:MAG TPA: hypothetical protein VD767_00385 [Thermomicrobiales bacterium]|nr:hypothetical protein [Thermomicrobiales bacterium]
MARILAFILLAASLVAGTVPVAASAGEPSPTGEGVDLAAVPLPPDELPERGYQFAQGGDIELSGLKFAWSGDGLDESDWVDIEVGWIGGHSHVLILLSDRADSASEPLASFTTYVLEYSDGDAAEGAIDDLLSIAGYTPTEDVDGVTVYLDQRGVLGAVADDGFVVIVQYAAARTDGPGQNTEDWTAGAMAELANVTVDRLSDLRDAAADGESTLGIANVMVTGPDAGWTLPWFFYPNTEHYRVLDGEVLPYGGELSAQTRDAAPGGIEDLFVSRQQMGDEQYDSLLDVTLARFESEADAESFAESPLPVEFPPGFGFEATHGPAIVDDGVIFQKVAVNDDMLRASGWRSIRQDGDLVQVVQWLGSGNAVVTEEAIAWVTGRQTSCVDALPEPCAPIDQESLPVALDAGQVPESTPTIPDGDESVIASFQFGWQVAIPDDGWTIIDAQIIGNSEYYQLQSGRSLVTIETAVDQVGDPQQCVVDNLRLLQEVEDRAVIELGSDDPDERPAGLEQGHGWAIYTVEPLQEERADQEYTIRIDCYTLVEGQASLVVTHTAPRDLWIEERDKGERFRDGIALPSIDVSTSTRPAGDRLESGRTTAMGIPRIWI